MADLDSLIRLRRHSVEEKQKTLATLYRQVEQFEIRRKLYEEELSKERQALEKEVTPEMLAYFGRYSDVVKRDVARIDQEIKKLEVRVQIAQDDVREAFANMKRIEIVQKQRQDAENKKEKAKEDSEMDDIGLDGYRRKQDEIQ